MVDSPVTCLIYTILPNWAPKVARRFHLPSVLLWIQPAFVFDIYYNYSTVNNSVFEFPNLPSLAIRDLPSFLSPSNTNKAAQAVYLELVEFLKEESNPKILVNTFDSLEPEFLTAIPNVEMVAVGPLLPAEIFTGSEPGKDISRDQSSSYTLWLDSKTESSVIYVSFGTMRSKIEGEEETEIEKIASFRHELEEVGMIVSWCSQIEVLRHRAVGCFVTHCGWSSSLESLVLGVPVVAFPMWSDQPANAKLLEEIWKTGVRVRENSEGLVERGEIKRCLEAVMEEKSEELKENAEKWKRLAIEAGGEGGTSDKNVEAFVKTLCFEVV
ncbi:unnamed protein product [Arabidopsis arenosa]|uniref:UDP-glycosyltransferases domain-containing protein n=1 Tax=Arabidopsis arenosa TaxID=38785 RepID=A0A8S1ZBP8_ARAAE|nr:unnamed protein product [Arabidopsis arenosa]